MTKNIPHSLNIDTIQNKKDFLYILKGNSKKEVKKIVPILKNKDSKPSVSNNDELLKSKRRVKILENNENKENVNENMQKPKRSTIIDIRLNLKSK